MQNQLPDFGELEEALEQKKEQFGSFYRLLTQYNGYFNLTAISGEEDVRVKHFLDSLAGAALLPQGSHVAEVGSGAGFPSIPLMIMREDLSFTLIESTGKKCEFLRTALGELGLGQRARVVYMRAEDAGKDPAFRERYDACVARAVARLNILAEYCMPLVAKGGRMIAYKGQDSELGEGQRAIALLGGGKTDVLSYELPGGYGARTLVCVEKSSFTPKNYPRGNGAERRRPL